MRGWAAMAKGTRLAREVRKRAVWTVSSKMRPQPAMRRQLVATTIEPYLQRRVEPQGARLAKISA